MKWSALSGGEKQRFCEQCQLHVHNLSAMSPGERREFLAQPAERKCIAYVPRPDAVAVRPGMWMLLERLFTPFRAAATALASLLPFFLSSCASTTQPEPPADPDTHASKQLRETEDGEMLLGDFCYEPSHMDRLFGRWR